MTSVIPDALAPVKVQDAPGHEMASKHLRTRRVLTSVLLGFVAVLMSTHIALAMSFQCRQINQQWSTGRTLQYLEETFDGLKAGEMITYFARTAISQVDGGNGVTIFLDYQTEGQVFGITTGPQEISGSFELPSDNGSVSVSLFSNLDTSVFLRLSCEGAEPKVESVTPSVIRASGNVPVIISGQRLSLTQSVNIGGQSLTPYFANPTQLAVMVPAQAVGTVDVIASSPRGTSEVSATSKLTFATEPGAPTIGAVSGTGNTASIPFSPSSDGGTPILDYTVVSTPGNFTATGAASPLSLSGLAAGTSYTFVVTARNVLGSSPASSASAPFALKSAQTINFPAPSPIAFGTAGTVAATASSGLAVSFSTTTPAICAVDTGGNVSPLTPGDCEVTADQSGDATYDAAPSVSRTLAIVPALPGAPVISGATAGDRSATISFNAPAFTGGAGIDLYRVTANPGGAYAAGTSSPLTVTGLTNGASYTFVVTAATVAGTGPASADSGAVTPKAPQSITLSDPGTVEFGSNVTIVGSASSGLPIAFTSLDTSVCTVDAAGSVTLLTPGLCSIVANQPGNTEFLSAPSVTRSFTIAGVAPAAPTGVSAVAGPNEASVSFTAPAFTGGTPIALYTVHVSPGGRTITGSASPILVTGLSNGTSYTFAVTATNGTGTSALSPASSPITPQGTQIITLSDPGTVAIDANVTIVGSASSGLPIALTSLDTSVCTVDAAGSVTLLTPGTCSIVANQPGNAEFLSAPSVTRSFTIAGVVPAAPTGVSVVAAPAEASVSFTAPTFTGGTPITLYTVHVSPGGQAVTGSASPILVTGLSNGTSYTFAVTATNGTGTSALSQASGPVTPKGTQTITLSDPGSMQLGASVSINASASSGLAVALASTTPAICSIDAGGAVTLLAPGACTIIGDQAGNAAFEPAPQAFVSFAIGIAAPGAPNNIAALARQGEAEVSFTAPAFTGGSPVTSYSVLSSPDGLVATGSASPIVVSGLRNGTSYSFVVTAINAVGPGAASVASNAVIPQGPQTISLVNPGPQIIGATLALSGSASSGLPLGFVSHSPGICSTSPAGVVTTLAAGQCIIGASQPGDAAHLPAAPVSTTFSVSSTQITIVTPAGPLARAVMGETYSLRLSASGQSGALQWSVTSGTLPSGLVLEANTGLISGTPSMIGDSVFFLSVTDLAGGGSASGNYSIAVAPREISAPVQTISVPAGTTPPPLNLSAGAVGGPFSGGTILGVEPEIAGTATINVGADVVLDFRPNPKFSGKAVVRYALTSPLGTSAPLSAIYLLTADLSKAQAELTQQRDQIVQSQSVIWLAGLSTPTFQDRLSAMSAATPASMSLSPSSGNSLTLAYAASTQTAALGAAESLALAEADAGGLRFWIDGSNTIHVRAGNAGEQWGSSAALSLGADMLATETMLLGLSMHADWSNTEQGNRKNTGTGLAIGPYLSVELAENLYLDASVLYGQSWNDMTDGIFVGSFGSTRLLAKAGLQGRLDLTDALSLSPGISLFYLREEAGAYIAADRGGTTLTIAPLLLEQLQMRAGGTLRYRLVADNGWTVQPFLGVELGTALSAGRFAHSASVSGGMDVQHAAGWSLGLSGRLFVQTDGMTALSAQTRLGMRF